MSTPAALAAVLMFALYAGHHVGDYWVQTDSQAAHKGDAGTEGALACLMHVLSYLATQVACLMLAAVTLGLQVSTAGLAAGLAISGVTHYLADRREHGVMLRLARLLGIKAFLGLGVPRKAKIYAQQEDQPFGPIALDNPSLGSGPWALDQAWHIFFGVFVAGLAMAGLS